MHIINLGLYDLILGLSYMRNHGIVIDPAKNRMWFRPNHYQYPTKKNNRETALSKIIFLTESISPPFIFTKILKREPPEKRLINYNQ